MTLDAIAELKAALDAHREQHPHTWDRAQSARTWPEPRESGGLDEFAKPTRPASPMLPAATPCAGTAPITRAPGNTSRVVLMRRAYNHRLADACRWWAVAATQRDPHAQAYYQRRRAAGDNHQAALRRVAGTLLAPAASLPDPPLPV